MNFTGPESLGLFDGWRLPRLPKWFLKKRKREWIVPAGALVRVSDSQYRLTEHKMKNQKVFPEGPITSGKLSPPGPGGKIMFSFPDVRDPGGHWDRSSAHRLFHEGFFVFETGDPVWPYMVVPKFDLGFSVKLTNKFARDFGP